MVSNNSSGNYATAAYIVSSVAGQGNYTTIQAAITAASSGDTIFLMPGTYTEDLTLTGGVNLSAYECDAFTPNVIISGLCTLSTSGTVSMSGICLQTNGNYALAVTGTASSYVNLISCYLNCSDYTGISLTSTGSSTILMTSCNGNIATTGVALFAVTAGTVELQGCFFTNTGASTTANTFSGGAIVSRQCHFYNPFTTSGTASWDMQYTIIQCQPINTTALTAGGGIGEGEYSYFISGTATAVIFNSTTPSYLQYCILSSSNTYALSGTGTVYYAFLEFQFSSGVNVGGSSQYSNGFPLSIANGGTGVSTIPTGLLYGNGTSPITNVTYETSTWTPTLYGETTAGTTTYTSQNGLYTRIGNQVTVVCNVVASALTGTGNLHVGGLPYTVNASNIYSTGAVQFSGAWTWPASCTDVIALATNSETDCYIFANGSGVDSAAMQITNAAISVSFSLTYLV